MKHLYTASAISSGDGRNGHARSSDGVLDLDLAIPVEMGGAGGHASNPEQLFAAGYAACFHSALKGVARREHVELEDSSVTAEIGLNTTEDGQFQLSADLQVEVPGVDQATAEKL